MNTKEIAAIVVTYNRKDLLKNCLTYLKNQTVKGIDIIVVDNASTDGTQELVEEWLDKGILYYNTGCNIGGAGGFQYGLKLAGELGYQYAWLMDDDTFVGKNTLKELIKADEILSGNYGFLSSIALWTDGSVCVMNRPKAVKSRYNKTLDHEYSIVPIYMTTFVSFFIKMSVVREVGLPIKEFFIWGDDVEYSQRISAKYPCFLVKKSRVIHATENNVGSNIAKDDINRLSRYQYAYRNEVYVAREVGFRGMIRQMAKIIYHCIRVIFTGKPEKIKKLGIILKSSLQGITFNPEIEYIN